MLIDILNLINPFNLIADVKNLISKKYIKIILVLFENYIVLTVFVLTQF